MKFVQSPIYQWLLLPCYGIEEAEMNCLFGSKKRRNNRSELFMAHPELSDPFIELSAYLVQRNTKSGERFFIEDVKEGGLAFSSGIEDSDRLVAIHKPDVKNLSFDEILEAIKCTSVIVLTVERSVKDKNVPIVIALDIGINSGGHPYLKFDGFYWNARFDDVQEFIPINCCRYHPN